MSSCEPDAEVIRGLLARKALADSRHRAVVASELELTASDVLAMQHLARAGALAPGDLAARLHLSSGGASALIQRLHALAYVTRERDPSDARRAVLRLSAAGERRAAELYAPLVRELDVAIGALAKRDREVIACFLARVAETGERHTERLLRAAEARRPTLPRALYPGLWS